MQAKYAVKQNVVFCELCVDSLTGKTFFFTYEQGCLKSGPGDGCGPSTGYIYVALEGLKL